MITKLGKKLGLTEYKTNVSAKLMQHLGIPLDSVDIYTLDNPTFLQKQFTNLTFPSQAFQADKDKWRKDLKGVPQISDSLLNKGRSVVVLSNPTTPILAHELGHLAGNLNKNQTWRDAYKTSNIASTLTGLFTTTPSLFASLLSGSNKVGKASSLATLAIASPLLYEEISSSGRALRAINEVEGTKEAIKAGLQLAPAQATYLATSALPYLGGRYGKFLNSHMKK